MNERMDLQGGMTDARPGMKGGAWRSGNMLLGVAVLLASCGGDVEQVPQGGPMQAMAVQVHVLRPGVLDNRLTTTGTLLANEEVEIVSELAGRVQALNFNEGGGVAAGQVLVRINDDELQAQLRKAEANLKLAQDDEARKSQLLAVKGISQEQYDAAVTQMAALQADVDDLRARVAKCTIRAPFAGTVGLRMVSEGGYVAPNTRIATLRQTDPIKLEFAVPERHGRELRAGTAVDFFLEGDTARYSAEVYAVDPSVDATTRTVKVRARTRNHGSRLLPGAFAKVDVRLERMNDALVVPAEALVPDIQGQKVLLMKGGKAVSARVQTGIRTAEEVQLTSGVQPGDTVIVSGLLALKDGASVQPIRNAPEPAKADTAR